MKYYDFILHNRKEYSQFDLLISFESDDLIQGVIDYEKVNFNLTLFNPDNADYYDICGDELYDI